MSNGGFFMFGGPSPEEQERMMMTWEADKAAEDEGINNMTPQQLIMLSSLVRSSTAKKSVGFFLAGRLFTKMVDQHYTCFCAKAQEGGLAAIHTRVSHLTDPESERDQDELVEKSSAEEN